MTLEDFQAWIRAELQEASALSHSADFETRKRANDKVEALRQTIKTLEAFIALTSVTT
jgi:hypothetical protein